LSRLSCFGSWEGSLPKTSDGRFERQAVFLYAIAGLSTVIVNLQIGLGCPALGEEAFTKAWEEGRVMTLEQAVAYAKEEYDT